MKVKIEELSIHFRKPGGSLRTVLERARQQTPGLQGARGPCQTLSFHPVPSPQPLGREEPPEPPQTGWAWLRAQLRLAAPESGE